MTASGDVPEQARGNGELVRAGILDDEQLFDTEAQFGGLGSATTPLPWRQGMNPPGRGAPTRISTILKPARPGRCARTA